MENARIVPMAERSYEMIPLDKIVILNSRSRERNQFEENVRSIDSVGLRQPIRVNRRNLAKTQCYELICGEGRYLAYKKLGRPAIEAEVVDCDEETAYLCSLIENMARVPPGTMWFAREMKRMHDDGMTYEKISTIVGKTSTYVSSYIQLLEQGEERLIKGVEQSMFPISFAVQVAHSDDAQVQNVLMDAFDSGMINTANISGVRQIVELRINQGKRAVKRNGGRSVEPTPAYTLRDLKRDVTRVTKEKEGFVRETTAKENRLFTMIMTLQTLSKDEQWRKLLTEAGLSELPHLEGSYSAKSAAVATAEGDR
jgi:ParB family transcriptional regulator, chromosome partitioning protein